jgi:hypothetical protein
VGNITANKIAGGLTKDQIDSVDTKTLVGVITNEQLAGNIKADKLDKTFYDAYINTKLDIKDPIGTGTFSFNRLANSTIGLYSTTFGNENTASGSRSFAIGYQT